MSATSQTALDVVKRLSAVGIALSAEKDNRRLMELILESAKDLTRADGGTLYSRTEHDELRFEIMLTSSLGVRMGGAGEPEIELPNLPLFDSAGRPNDKMVAARAAVTGETVNIPDAYDARDFDFSGTRAFDERTGYRSKSFLTVPMRNHEDEVIGVLQLINAIDAGSDEIIPFGMEEQLVVESLASQAAIALTNKRLIDEQRELFESFIELIAAAIDDKSPYTGGHCRRVPELTMMLADAAAATRDGPLREFAMSDEDRYELRIAGWLHDCGKVTTPEYVVDKATKLETIHDRLEMVQERFEAHRRGLRVTALEEILAARDRGDTEAEGAIRSTLDERLAALDDDLAFIQRANKGGEFMSNEDQERVRRIGAQTRVDRDGNEAPLLTDNEVENLTIARGTLTEAEREVINYHIVATIKMLESLPYPKHLRRVPEFAGGHHERMDGKGYPRGLVRDEMSVQARVMGIADIFEALTAGDRPYKEAMKLSQALQILGRMKLDEHVDPDLFDVFIREGVYLDYANRFLEPHQIDDVDLDSLPGYSR